MAAHQNQINPGTENCIPLPGLFEIVAQSADGTAKLFPLMYVDVVRKWMLFALRGIV